MHSLITDKGKSSASEKDEGLTFSVETSVDIVKEEEKKEIEESEVVTANGFEVVPDSALSFPFTSYVDFKNLIPWKEDSSSKAEDESNLALFLKDCSNASSKNLKTFLRNNSWGPRHPIRGNLWKRVCETVHKAKGNLYNEFEKELYQRNNEDFPLPSFVDFDNLTSYHLTQQSKQTVTKILAVIQNTNPEILYCPTLYPMMCMFLHYMEPSDAFNCVYALLHAKDVYIMQTKVAVEASKLVIRDLTKKFAKSAYVYLVRNSNYIDTVFEAWMSWIFSALPFPYLVRIIDCYLVEGVKVLYRSVLSILILFTKYSAKQPGTISSNSCNLVDSIHQFCTNMPFTVEKVLKKGFSIRGLTRKEIKKLQLKHELTINSYHHHQQEITKSQSSHSIGIHHSHSFSGRIVFEENSSIVEGHDLLYTIWSWLPARFAVCQPELLYTSEEHGTSLMTLYSRIENHQPTLILIKTTDEEVFGAFCSTYWRDRRRSTKNVSYFGTGETFIFTLSPERKKYDWVGLHQEEIPNTANMFLAGDSSILTVGGGNGEAIQLDENLLHCRTEKCDTFDNAPLCSHQDFTCKVVEVYGFH